MATRRRYSPTESATLKAIALVRKAGLRIAAVEFPRDGMVRVVTTDVDTSEDTAQDAGKPEPWT